MRVTATMQNRSFLENVERLKTRMDQAQREVSSGKTVNRLSDNPFAASQASQISSVASANDQFIAGNTILRSKLELTDSLLQSLIQNTDTAKTLAVQGLSGTTTPESREALATAVEGVRQQVLSTSNTQFAGTYLFSGTLTRTEPFVDAAGTVTYQGNDEATYQRMDRVTIVQTNVTGQDLFVDPPSVFTALSNLKTAILNNDTTAIKTELDNLETISSRLNTTAATFGNKMQLLDQLQSSLQDRNEALQKQSSVLTDADLAKSITDLNLTNQALTLTMQAQGQQLSLLDFLR